MPTPTADDLLALGRGYMECRILLTAAELDLFTLLSRGPRSAAEVTQHLGGAARPLTMLLDALAAMGLLTKRDGRYLCPPELAVHLSADSPTSITAMLLHQANLWPSWSELTGIAQGDRDAWDRAHAPRGDAGQAAFIGAMHVVAGKHAAEVVAAIQPGGARRLLDVGGASGTYTLAFLAAAPNLRATLFDLPPVVEMARARLARAGVLDRVTLAGGDFYADPLPPGHDLALLSAIIHQNSPEQNVALYRKVWDALEPGGRLVIRDHVLSPDRTQPRAAAVFAINMLVRTAGGNCYTFDEMRATLAAAGFERVRLVQPGDARMTGLVEAFRPSV